MTAVGIPPAANVTRLVKDVLEGSLRLHASQSLEERVEAAVDFLRLITEGCRAMVATRSGSGVLIQARGHADFDAGQGAVFEHARRLALKSHDDGVTLVDPTARGMGYALPIFADGRPCGAVFVASDNASRRLDASDLDAIRAATEVIGLAFAGYRPMVSPQPMDPVVALLSEESDGSGTGHSLRSAKNAFERRLLRSRLIECQGNIAAAARTLKMDRGQLSRLLKKHRVDKSIISDGASPDD